MGEDVRPPAEGEQAIYQHEDFRLTAERRDALYRTVLEESRLDPEYLAMLALSALIALLGLLQNSAAVIIGAMLISPLMNPILAAALALVLGDGKLGRRTAIVLGLSIFGAILITWMVASAVPLRQPTPEILARVNPNILDLFIAFLSGLAGTLALRSGSSTLMIIPGVAIAVAVVPPLAVVGYGLSAGQGTTAGGAFLLFITNLVSILISASIVFLLMGYRPGEEAERTRLKLRNRIAISALVLTVLSIPLIQTLRRAVIQVRLRSEIASVLDRAFATEHSSVTTLNFSRQRQGLRVKATIHTTEYFDDKAIQTAEKAMQESLGSDTRLEIEQIMVTHGGLTQQQVARLRDFISGGVVQPAPEKPPYDFRASQEEILAHLQGLVDEVLVLAGAPFRPLGPLRAHFGVSQPVTIVLRLASPSPLEAQTVQLLAAQLSAKLSLPVELHGEVELEDPSYELVIEKSTLRRGLTLEQRRAITEFLKPPSGRQDLRLRVTVATASEPTEKASPSLLQRQVEGLLAQSPLGPHQWNLQTATIRPAGTPSIAPPGTTGASPTGDGQAQASGQGPSVAVRCEFRVIQDF